MVSGGGGTGTSSALPDLQRLRYCRPQRFRMLGPAAVNSPARMALATCGDGAEAEQGPNTVDEDELREAVSKYWQIDDMQPAFIHANIAPADLGAPFQMPAHDRDEKGRMKLPAYLLTAHKDG